MDAQIAGGEARRDEVLLPPAGAASMRQRIGAAVKILEKYGDLFAGCRREQSGHYR